MYKKDNRIVATLDAGGTNFVFGAMKAGEFIIDPVSVPAQSHDLDLCLQNMVNGFQQVFDKLDEKPVAISFAFPGPEVTCPISHHSAMALHSVPSLRASSVCPCS